MEIDPEALKPPYWDGEDAKYVSVSVDCSAYGRWNKDWQDMLVPRFFLEEDEIMAVIEDGSYHQYNLKVPEDTRDLYVIPPKIRLLQNLEEQLISLDQDYPIQTEYFNVVSAYVPELINWNPMPDPNFSPESVILRVYMTSGTEQYPYFLSLIYDGKTYPFRGTSWEGDGNSVIRYICYHCEMPDLYTAAMGMKYGSLRYSKLQTFVLADEAVYTCNDETINVHIITLK